MSERRLSADMRFERYGAAVLGLVFTVAFLYPLGLALCGVLPCTAVELLPTFVAVIIAVATIRFIRALHDVYLQDNALRVTGPHVNAVVPLTKVRYVELLPMGRGRRRIALTFDRDAGVGGSIEFVPAGAPLVGGGEEIAKELTQLVKDAHGPT